MKTVEKHNSVKFLILIVFIMLIFLNLPISGLTAFSSEEPYYLQLSTLYGEGRTNEDGYAMVVDNEGNVYVIGASNNGTRSVLIVKFDPNGNILFSKIFGGSDHDTATDIALDSKGNLLIVGITESNDFPTTNNAFNQTYSGPGGYSSDWGCCGDGFLSILSPDGNEFLYSSYLGGTGSDSDLSVELDELDNIYIAGITDSLDFPTTIDASNSSSNGGFDIFIIKFSANASSLMYSSYLGGSGDEIPKFGVNGKWLVLDKSNNIIIGGYTSSANYPTTVNALDFSLNGGTDSFVTKLSTNGSVLLFSTYLGGDGHDGVFTIEVDNNENIILAGTTNSLNFPVTENILQSDFAGGSCSWGSFGGNPDFFGTCGDMFLTKLSKDGILLHSTYFGGSNRDIVLGIIADNNDDLFISGFSYSTNLPTTASAFQQNYKGGSYDGYFAKISSNLSSILYATYIGTSDRELINGVTLNDQGEIFLTGFTTSSQFPIVNSDSNYNGGWDLIFIKMNNSPVTFTETSISITSTTSNVLSTTKTTTTGFSILSIFTPVIVFTLLIRKNNKKF